MSLQMNCIFLESTRTTFVINLQHNTLFLKWSSKDLLKNMEHYQKAEVTEYI